LLAIFTIKAENSEFQQGAVCPSLVPFIRARAEKLMYPPHVQFDCPTWDATCQLAEKFQVLISHTLLDFTYKICYVWEIS